jgi:hypothetical protein
MKVKWVADVKKPGDQSRSRILQQGYRYRSYKKRYPAGMVDQNSFYYCCQYVWQKYYAGIFWEYYPMQIRSAGMLQEFLI